MGRSEFPIEFTLLVGYHTVHMALTCSGITRMTRDRPIMHIFYLLCYAAVLKILIYYRMVQILTVEKFD